MMMKETFGPDWLYSVTTMRVNGTDFLSAYEQVQYYLSAFYSFITMLKSMLVKKTGSLETKNASLEQQRNRRVEKIRISSRFELWSLAYIWIHVFEQPSQISSIMKYINEEANCWMRDVVKFLIHIKSHLLIFRPYFRWWTKDEQTSGKDQSRKEGILNEVRRGDVSLSLS